MSSDRCVSRESLGTDTQVSVVHCMSTYICSQATSVILGEVGEFAQHICIVFCLDTAV